MYFCRGFKKRRKRGHRPFFLLFGPTVISKEHIAALAGAFLEGTGNYLIDVKVRPSNRIVVYIENDDTHVAIKDCIALSRYIEQQLDRNREDFELEVSSPGIDQPFRDLRQYRKYLGKAVEVKLLNGEVRNGVLDQAGADMIRLRPDPGKKKKKPTGASAEPTTGILELPMKEVKETRLKLIF